MLMQNWWIRKHVRRENTCISQNVLFFFAIHISIKYIDNKSAMGALHRILCLPGLRKHRLGWWGHHSTWDGVFYPHCAFVIGWNGWVCVKKGIVTIWRIKNSVGKRENRFQLKALQHLWSHNATVIGKVATFPLKWEGVVRRNGCMAIFSWTRRLLGWCERN